MDGATPGEGHRWEADHGCGSFNFLLLKYAFSDFNFLLLKYAFSDFLVQSFRKRAIW